MRWVLCCLVLVSVTFADEKGPRPIATINDKHTEIHRVLKDRWSNPQFDIRAMTEDEIAAGLKKRRTTKPEVPGVFVACDDDEFLGVFSSFTYLLSVDGKEITSPEALVEWRKGMVNGRGYKFAAMTVTDLGPGKPLEWRKKETRIEKRGLREITSQLVRTTKDPVEKFVRTEPTMSGPMVLYSHKPDNDGRPSLMMRLTVTSPERIDAEQFKVALSGKTFPFDSLKIRERSSVLGNGIVYTYSATTEVTDEIDLIKATAGALGNKEPRVVRIASDGEFTDRVIPDDLAAANFAVIEAYYAARFGE